MPLSHSSCLSIYNKLKSKALSHSLKNNYHKSLQYIKCAAKWAYRLNFIYVDRDLERILVDIADKSLNKATISSPNHERFILLDTHGMDNRGLTQQYIRAFIAMGVEFMFISVDCIRNRCTEILKELQDYEKATVVLFDNSIDDIEKSRQIIAKIDEYRPSKLFLHLMPWDTTSLMVAHSLQGVTKYNINLTDHAFWLGASILDYNIEFRSYGKTVSLEKRGLNERQLLYLPYYPILSKGNVDFLGFPEAARGKIVIFTGGAYYKMFGQNGKFFTILDLLLDQNRDAVVLIAGNGNRHTLGKLLSKLKNRSRIYLIGNRRDINEVFKACDVYLDTYPIGGGLMMQYAGMNAKPILSFKDFESFESNPKTMLQVMGNGVCGYNDIEKFLKYSKKILSEVDYRLSEGNENKYLVPSVEDFNETFNRIIMTHENKYKWNTISINYSIIDEIYLNVENSYTHAAVIELVKGLKSSTILDLPKYIIYFVHTLLTFLINRVMKNN